MPLANMTFKSKHSVPALALMLLFATPAAAQLLSDRGPPQHRVIHRNTLAIRVNPLGLIYEGRFAYRYRLYASESAALRDNFLGIGISPGASPAFAKIGVYAEVQPATILGFWATYEFMQYFGTFNLFQSFPGSDSNFSDAEIKRRGELPAGDPLRPRAKGGSLLTVGVNLNLKVGPIVIRSQMRIFRPEFQLRAGDTGVYDQFSDLLLPNRRLSLINDLDVLFQTQFGLIAGLRYNLGVPFYGEENVVAGGRVDNSTHRLGPFIAFRFFDHDGRKFNQPTVAVVVNWYLKHPYRTGVETSQAVPYFALALNMVGDLLPLAPAPEKPQPIEAPVPAVAPAPAAAAE
jgi:hypothetical protein